MITTALEMVHISKKENKVDIFYLVTILAFFILSACYIERCERL